MIDRINQIIQSKGLSLSGFAEEIGVQRSSISHILSGRNRPSLDFVVKVLDRYPEISSDWLISGKGSFKEESNLFKQSNEDSAKDLAPKESISGDEDKNQKVRTNGPIPKTDDTFKSKDSRKSQRNIKKIILLYEDDTYEEVIPK